MSKKIDPEIIAMFQRYSKELTIAPDRVLKPFLSRELRKEKRTPKNLFKEKITVSKKIYYII